MQSFLNSKRHLASAAARFGLEKYIKLCPKSGKASDYVVTLAMRAIIGAAWKDAGNLNSVEAIVKRLKLVAAISFDHHACADCLSVPPLT